MPVRYNLSSVWVRLSIFPQLSFMQYVGLCVFSLPISFVMIERNVSKTVYFGSTYFTPHRRKKDVFQQLGEDNTDWKLRIGGPFCREISSDRWSPLTKAMLDVILCHVAIVVQSCKFTIILFLRPTHLQICLWPSASNNQSFVKTKLSIK